MDRRSIIHKLPEYKGYSAYYYYDDEDKIWVGHVYNSSDGEFTDMIAWHDENEDAMEHLFYSMVDDYINFKAEMEEKYGKPLKTKR
nr:MAG TPA: hypothetical protein [Bacteriophage sp.]